MRIQWDLTSGCNLRCRHCNTLPRRSSGIRDLKTEAVKKIIDNFHSSGVVDTILFGGGEVTLRRDFSEIVRYATERGIAVWFTTNGQTFTDEKLADIMSNNLGAICVSIDGATAETHEWVRGKGTFKRAIECLRKVAEEKERNGYDTLVEMSYTVMRRNMHEAEQAATLAHSLGADVLCFLHLVDPRIATLDWRYDSPSPEERLDLSRRLAESAVKLQRPTLLPVPPRVIDQLRRSSGYEHLHTSMRDRCSAGQHLSFLGANGTLVPCVAVYDSPKRDRLLPKDTAPLNLLNNNLRDVYFSETFTDFIKAANDPSAASKLPAICQDCSYRLERKCQPYCLIGGFEDGDFASQTCELALQQGLFA